MVRESFESLTEYNKNAKALFQDVIDEHNAKLKKKDPKAKALTKEEEEAFKLNFVKQVAQMNYLLVSQKKTSLGKKKSIFTAENFFEVAKTMASIWSGAQESILKDTIMEAMGPKFGIHEVAEGVVESLAERTLGEAAKESVYSLFNYEAYASIIELGFAVKSLIQSDPEPGFGADKAEVAKTLLGVLALVDPTGVTNIM